MTRVAAHAKVNLILAAGPPEPPGSARPGWHRIASWVSCIDLVDDLELARLPDGSTSSYTIGWAADAPRPTPIDWPIDRDLAVRAHRLLEQHAGRPLPIELRLAKRIPVGGGLGGGSSDAAALLIAVNRLFGLSLSIEQLRALGSRLGSDVPFFIDDRAPARPALITGFGDEILRVPAATAELLLVIPPFSCPTAEVYAASDALPAGPASRAINEAGVRSLVLGAPAAGPAWPGMLFNTLLPAACQVRPALSDLVVRLGDALQRSAAAPAKPHLSGSGSCLFIVLGREHRPPEIAMQVRAAAPGCAVRRTRLT